MEIYPSFFSDPAFSGQFAELQQETAQTSQLSKQLFQTMVDSRTHRDEALAETEDRVSYYIERLILPDDDREVDAWLDILSPKEQAILRSQRTSSERAFEIQKSMMELAPQAGLDQFAVFSLQRHVWGSLHRRSISHVEADVIMTDTGLREFQHRLETPAVSMRLALAAVTDANGAVSRHISLTELESFVRLCHVTQRLYSTPLEDSGVKLKQEHETTSFLSADKPVMSDCITPRKMVSTLKRIAAGNKPGMRIATETERLVKGLDQTGTANATYARQIVQLLGGDQ